MSRHFVFLPLIAALFLPLSAIAHPHVFINASVKLEADKQGNLTSIHLEWLFDPVFSSDLMTQFDANKNKALETAEYDAMGRSVLPNLKEFSYFTHLRQDGKVIKVKPEQFKAAFTDKRIRFKMVMQPESAVTLKGKKTFLSLYDDSYYVDVALVKESAQMEGISCKSSQFNDQDNLIYSGLIAPITLSVKC